MAREDWMDRSVSDPSWIGKLPKADQWIILILFLPIWAPFCLFLATFSPAIDLMSFQFDRIGRREMKDLATFWGISFVGTVLFYVPLILFM